MELLLSLDSVDSTNATQMADTALSIAEDMALLLGVLVTSIDVLISADGATATVLVLDGFTDSELAGQLVNEAILNGKLEGVSAVTGFAPVHRKKCVLRMEGNLGEGSAAEAIKETDFRQDCPATKYNMSVGLWVMVTVTSGVSLCAFCAAGCFIYVRAKRRERISFLDKAEEKQVKYAARDAAREEAKKPLEGETLEQTNGRQVEAWRNEHDSSSTDDEDGLI